MPVSIEIEGLPGANLQGKVTKVNEYPAPDNWFNSNVKEYATTIEVFNPPAGLRPGMTAQVAIRVETIDDVRAADCQLVGFSAPMEAEERALKHHLYAHLYDSDALRCAKA